MTFEEAEKKLRDDNYRFAAIVSGINDPDILLAIIDEIKRHREFLYARMGELP